VDIPVFNIGDVRVDHESDQIEYEVRALPENAESCKAEVFETRIVRRLCTSHSVHHFLAHLDRRWEGFRITSQNISEIDCKLKINNRVNKGAWNKRNTMEEMACKIW
jgi:hypothetical protein